MSFPIEYKASAAGDMVQFLKAVHGNSKLALRITSLKFTLPYDNLVSSGVFEWLENYEDDWDEDSDEALAWTDENEWCILRLASFRLHTRMGLFGEAANFPILSVLNLYILLFSVCENVTTIEVPAEFAPHFVSMWDDGVFPKVDRTTTAMSENETFKWGRDVESVCG